MNRYYIAVTEKHGDKFYSYWIFTTSNDNALSKLSNKNLIHANIFSSRKKAAEVSDLWNNGYKDNKTYLFQNA